MLRECRELHLVRVDRVLPPVGGDAVGFTSDVGEVGTPPEVVGAHLAAAPGFGGSDFGGAGEHGEGKSVVKVAGDRRGRRQGGAACHPRGQPNPDLRCRYGRFLARARPGFRRWRECLSAHIRHTRFRWRCRLLSPRQDRQCRGFVYNAPVVSYGATADQLNPFCDGAPDYALVHDKVTSICPASMTVTINLTAGFSFAKPVLYLSTEASDETVATLEGATFTPALRDITVGHDDSAFSPVERIFVTANGPTGTDNLQRQGLNSAILDGRSPLNVLGGIPSVATDYSPIWDASLGVWTQVAIDKGYRARVTEEFQILGLVEQGWITGPGGTEYGSIGIVINCPIVWRFL